VSSPRLAFATGLCVAVAGTAVACVPAALRTASEGVSFVTAWLVLWGSTALLLAPAAAAIRIARPLSRAALALPAALLCAAPLLIVFARVLKVATHHRPLGAATFAVIAAGVVLGTYAATARLASGERLAQRALLAWVGLSALATAVLLLPLLGVAGGSLLDAALVLGVAALAVLIKAPPALERVAKVAGPVALVVAVGASFALGSPPVRAAAAERAPVLAGPLF
jgi:hypothetical protein